MKNDRYVPITLTGAFRPCEPEYGWSYAYDKKEYIARYSNREVEERGGWDNNYVSWKREWKEIPKDEFFNTHLTHPGNTTANAKRELARWNKANGFDGPLNAGEVKCLKALLTKLGKADHIKRSFLYAKVKRVHQGYYKRGMEYYGTTLKYCYLFKSPMPGMGLKDFIKLARMYKGDEGMRKAVLALLERPVEELKEELAMFGTIEKLASLGAAA